MLQNNILNLKWAKRGVVYSIITTLIITALEFPPPVGFETRPFVIADQIHLLQPEVATPLYSVIEITGAIVSMILIYFAWRVHKIYSNYVNKNDYE